MLKVTINGKFLADGMQGIVRYARELVCALDEVIDDGDDVVLVVPPDAADIPELRRISVTRFGSLAGIPWEQFDLPRYQLLHPRRTLLNLCNVAPILSGPGITAIHDVMYKACPEYYVTPRNRLSRAWHCLQYSFLTMRERAILTVSEFSRSEIERYYPRARGKVHVVADAWQHVLRIVPSNDWRERYPNLEPGEYLFSMATLSRNKNGAWIYEVARRNPQLTFAMAGRRYESDEVERPSNVHLLGYVSDEDACALMQNCRAFLFPSLYEGFGIPPLEALALGAQVIASNSTSLPEVLGESAHFVDPCDPEVSLEELLAQPVAEPQAALGSFAWESSAQDLRWVLALGQGDVGRGDLSLRHATI